VKGQYPKGLRTPLIIRDPQELYSSNVAGRSWDVTAPDSVLSLSDWFFRSFDALDDLYLSNKCGSTGIVPPPECKFYITAAPHTARLMIESYTCQRYSLFFQ
jgi:hypothetical protein